MNVLGLFLNHRPTTGGHKRYLELLRGLAERGHEVTLIVAAERGTDEAALTAAGVRLVSVVTRVPRFAIAARVSAARRWRRAVARAAARGSAGNVISGGRRAAASVVPAPSAPAEARERGSAAPDVVLVFGETHVPAARLVARRAGAPLVVALRSNLHAELSAFGAHRGAALVKPLLRVAEEVVVRARERLIARSAARIIFQTEGDRGDFIRRRPKAASRTAVVPNSIDASWFDPSLRDAHPSHTLSHLIYVGALNRRKGVLGLLDAVAELLDEERSLTLEIAGSGPLEAAVQARIAERGLSGSVALSGHVSDALSRIARADLLVLPSLYDSFPNVLLEALHTGTPAVATDAGGAREILAAEELLVPPGDPRALAAAIRRLADDPGAYRRACEHVRGRRKAFEFDWVGRFEAVVEDLHRE